MNALRHQFACHTLGEPSLTVRGCGKGATQGIALEGGTGVGEDDRAARALRIGLQCQNALGCLLRNQKCAVGGVAHNLEENLGIHIGDLLAEDIAGAPVDIMHHQPWRPELRAHCGEQFGDRCRFGCVALVDPGPMVGRKSLQGRFIRSPGGHCHLHALARKQTGTAGTHPRATTYNQRYFSTHLPCSFL